MKILNIIPNSVLYKNKWESYGFFRIQDGSRILDRKESLGVMFDTKEVADKYFENNIYVKYSNIEI